MNGIILDVIVIVIAVLFIIFGIWRGLYKMVYGFISSLLALVLAVVLCTTVTNFVVDKTTIDDKLYSAIDQPLQNAIPENLHATDVVISFNADATVTITYESATYETLSEYLTKTNSSIAALGSLMDSVILGDNAMNTINPSLNTDSPETVNTTLANVISSITVVYIMDAIVFLLLWIVAYIIVRLLMLIIKQIAHKTYIGHFLDKLLGFVLGAGFAMVIIWGALAVIKLLATYTWIVPVNEVIESSTITKWLFDNNYLYNLLVSTTNLQESISTLIGNFTQAG